MIREQFNVKAWRPQRRRHLMHLAPFCYYCGVEVTEWTGEGAPPKNPKLKPRVGFIHYATLDHLVPIACGGQDTDENTVLACACCNYTKGNRSYEEFMRIRKVSK